MSIFTPQNQTKLTNVSTVRLRQGGKRFELACYKNKIMEYINGTVTDLDQVLQSWHIFSNVGRGKVASNHDLNECFNTKDTKVIVSTILNKGEIQLGTKERTHQLEALKKDISMIVSRICIDKTTGQPLTPTMIEKLMLNLHMSIKPELSAKQQALDVVKRLEKDPTLNVTRSKMRVKVVCPTNYRERVTNTLDPKAIVLSRKDQDGTLVMECLIESHEFKPLIKEID